MPNKFTLPEESQKTLFQKAVDNFEVIQHDHTLQSVWLEAEADTGSRYVAMLTQMPPTGRLREGGQHLISLLQPWQANMVYTVFPNEEIHLPYISEKLCGDHDHPGDIAAVQLAVNTAIKLATQTGIVQ